MKQRPLQLSLFVPFAVMAVVFGLLIVQKYRESREIPQSPPLQQTASTRKVILFFSDDKGSLAREAREMESCDSAQECLRNVLDELVGGPVGELDQTIPDGTALLGVSLDGDLATVDLNAAFSLGLAGSRAEMLAVYSIVNTACHNFPAVSRVRIHVTGDEGEEILMKHLDLREPLEPDWAMEQPPASRGGAGPAGAGDGTDMKGKR